MVDAAKPHMGYWKIRGLAAPIRYLFHYCGVDYSDTQYTDPTVWATDKDDKSKGFDFPNLPYLSHGDVRLTESEAILRYICNTWKPELLGKTPHDRASVDMLISVLKDVKSPVTGACYAPGSTKESLAAKIYEGKIG